MTWKPILLSLAFGTCLLACGDDTEGMDDAGLDAEMDALGSDTSTPSTNESGELSVSSRVTDGWHALGESAFREGVPLGLQLAESPEERDPERFLRVAGLHLINGQPLLVLPTILTDEIGNQEPALRLVRWDGENWSSDLIDLGESVIGRTSSDGDTLRIGVFERLDNGSRVGVTSFTDADGVREIDWFGEIESRNATIAQDGDHAVIVAHDWRQPDRVQIIDYQDGEYTSEEHTAPNLNEFQAFVSGDRSWLVAVVSDEDASSRRAIMRPVEDLAFDGPSLFPVEYSSPRRLGVFPSSEADAWVIGDGVRMVGDAGIRERVLMRVQGGESTVQGYLPQVWAGGDFAAVEVDDELVVAMPFAGPGQQDLRVVVVSDEGEAHTLDRDAPGGGGISNSQDVRSELPLVAADDEQLCVLWSERTQPSRVIAVRLLCHDLPLP